MYLNISENPKHHLIMFAHFETINISDYMIIDTAITWITKI